MMIVAFLTQTVFWGCIVVALNGQWFTDLQAQYGTRFSVVGLVLLIPLGLVGFLPALLVRDRMLLGQIRRVLVERGTCLKCRYSLIGLPVVERKFVICSTCKKPVQIKDTKTHECPSCEDPVDGKNPQSEWVVICAECGCPGLVDSSISELTINPETSTVAAAKD